MRHYDREIQELEEKLKVLKEEKKSFDLMQPNYRLAELLHSKFCKHNHTDGCSWYYENWEGMGNKSTKNSYLEKANKLLEIVNYSKAVEIINIL